MSVDSLPICLDNIGDFRRFTNDKLINLFKNYSKLTVSVLSWKKTVSNMSATPHPADGACRLCDQNNRKMFNIFSKNSRGRQIVQLIKEFLPLIVFRSDPLSKQVCETCLDTLERFSSLKCSSSETASKRLKELESSQINETGTQLYLACNKESQEEDMIVPTPVGESSNTQGNKGTSTDDLRIACVNCKFTYFEINNEIELCNDRHPGFVQTGNKSADETENKRATRRARSQAFYHELDDSLCSSLTEANTEGSQCFEEYVSEFESYESELDEGHLAKRPKLDNGKEGEDEDYKEELRQLEEVNHFKEIFKDGVEYHYFPLSLMELALNAVNKVIVPDHEPFDFYRMATEPECSFCNVTFKNSRLLALHEVEHISIELGNKIDDPVFWHESRDDAHVRNKWLNVYEDANDDSDEPAENEQSEEGGMEEDDEEVVVEMDVDVGEPFEEGLLVPVGTEASTKIKTRNQTVSGANIELCLTRAFVNGVPLQDYTKSDRKAFYKNKMVGTRTRKYCDLCHYLFKDNWAIEYHYFSQACYYTCRYCGMRFNKQRANFSGHVLEHEQNGDRVSNKVFTSSKVSSYLPKIVKTETIKVGNSGAILVTGKSSPPKKTVNNKVPVQAKLAASGPDIVIKQEKVDAPEPVVKNSVVGNKGKALKMTPTANQAYFCRKCYKVFFRLDEFNIHSKNCDFNLAQNPVPSSTPNNSQSAPPSKTKGGGDNNATTTTTTTNSATSKNGNMTEYVSPTGRPMRHCVRESGPYRDEPRLADSVVKEMTFSQQSFVCYICNTPFPTIYSRNSHMRIHKKKPIFHVFNEQPNNTRSSNNTRSTSRSVTTRNASANNVANNATERVPAYPAYVKSEPIEPEVQIHDGFASSGKSGGGMAAVSITPISKNPNQKATINPNIMKLVQNNPHLTIKTNSPPVNNSSGNSSSSSSGGGGSNAGFNNSVIMDDRSYKCASCGETFLNKSHLYFHKKNQCQGSKYPCPFCKKRFGTASEYSSHIFYSHPE